MSRTSSSATMDTLICILFQSKKTLYLGWTFRYCIKEDWYQIYTVHAVENEGNIPGLQSALLNFVYGNRRDQRILSVGLERLTALESFNYSVIRLSGRKIYLSFLRMFGLQQQISVVKTQNATYSIKQDSVHTHNNILEFFLSF